MKRPIIDSTLEASIQDYANKNHNGNFTEAVNSLIRSGLLNGLSNAIKNEKTA